jgi:hypothetical protein
MGETRCLLSVRGAFGCVTRNLDLTWMLLNGTIPSTIGNLVNLQELRLDNAYFTGGLPESISNLVQLTCARVLDVLQRTV